MKNNRFLTSLILLFLNIGLYAQTDSLLNKNGLVWNTDLMVAQEASVETKKPIFAFFTGSDWCGWCMKLQKDVFAKKEFIEWAKKSVVLLELDFPRGKQINPMLMAQNNNLQQALQVQGYPTIWILYLNKDESQNKFDIVPLGSLGYPRSAEVGKEEVQFLKDANSILKNGKKK